MLLLRKPTPDEDQASAGAVETDGEEPPLRIGVISDTHGFLDPKVMEIFEGVDQIIHAGDIGLPWLIMELEQLAPVVAVTGNVDVGLEFRETEVFECAGHKFLLHHIVDINDMDEKVEKRIIREGPDIVIYGHTHARACEQVGATLYLNPGYAGKPKQDQERTVAILTCDSEGITADFFDLDAPSE